MASQSKIKTSIIRAISFIKSKQDERGAIGPSHSTFHTSLIMTAVGSCVSSIDIPNEEATTIMKKGRVFLLREMGKGCSWNYWQKRTPSHGRCPDDLDDTAMALTALHLADRSSITGKMLARFIGDLVRAEEKVGGPYNTWLMPKADARWKDVDIAVNGTVRFFLRLQKISTPVLDAFIKESLRSGRMESRYYPPYSMLYFLSRAYRDDPSTEETVGKAARQMLRKIRRKIKKGSLVNPAAVAAVTAACIRLRETVEDLISYLLKIQNEDGSWEAGDFYIEEIRSGVPIWSSGKGLSTALCAEALSLYRTSQAALSHMPDKDSAVALRAMRQAIVKRFGRINKKIAAKAVDFFDTLIKRSPNDAKLMLIPTRFAQALSVSPRSDITFANLCGVLAYRIYDDIIDDDGSPALMAIAAIAARETVAVYADLLGKKADPMMRTVRDILDALDAANDWEINHCRWQVPDDGEITIEKLPSFGRYGVIAEKSMGMAIGPLVILRLLGYKEKSPEARGLLLFFKHYIIARQLNDDAHDWFKDLQKGHLNPVNMLVLKEWRSKNDARDRINVRKEESPLRTIFHENIMRKTIIMILKHCDIAKKATKQGPFVSFCDNLLSPLIRAADGAHAESRLADDFLKHYATLAAATRNTPTAC